LAAGEERISSWGQQFLLQGRMQSHKAHIGPPHTHRQIDAMLNVQEAWLLNRGREKLII